MITGLTLKNSIISGANNLSNRRAKVDELNVFPVPDGDTGTNMGMTIGAARTELLNLPDDCTVEKAAQVTASAMLRGARGNSGVILSLLVLFPACCSAAFPRRCRAKKQPMQRTLCRRWKNALRVHTRP